MYSFVDIFLFSPQKPLFVSLLICKVAYHDNCTFVVGPTGFCCNFFFVNHLNISCSSLFTVYRLYSKTKVGD